MKRILLIGLLATVFHQGYSQETYPVNGSYDVRSGQVAFTNAQIVVNADHTISNGTLLVKGSTIEAVGQGIKVPQGYVVVDLKGKYIYPSLIDAYSTYGVPETPRAAFSGQRRQVYVTTKKGAYGWNEAIRPEMNVKTVFSTDAKKAEDLKKLGFGTVHSVIRDGIARGTSLVATLTDEKENQAILSSEAAAN